MSSKASPLAIYMPLIFGAENDALPCSPLGERPNRWDILDLLFTGGRPSKTYAVKISTGSPSKLIKVILENSQKQKASFFRILSACLQLTQM